MQGPGVMAAYHNLPDATAKVLTNGWYHTADFARRDENGFIRISGRLKELTIRGGENIYPSEIEDVLVESSAVADVAVVAARRCPWPSLSPRPGTPLTKTRSGAVPRGTVVFQSPLEIHCRRRNPTHRVGQNPTPQAQLSRPGSVSAAAAPFRRGRSAPFLA